MSQSDFMLRQRYVENSGYKDSFYQTVSVASNPFEPNLNSSDDVRHFVEEQRKIIANFRAQPWPMKMKMAARKAYRHNLTKYTQDLNTVDTFRDLTYLFLKNLKRKSRNFIEYMTIWNSIIKQIEGHFGSSVASFFVFLRWMCALNFILLLMIFGFLIIPQVLGGHGLNVPTSVRENGSAFSFIIDGTGYEFEYSVLFYGYYDSGRNEPYHAPPYNPTPNIGWGYRLPLAYLLSIVGIFIISILMILFSMAKNYKILQRANVSEQYLFAWKVFASWDYTITNKEMVSSKARQILILLKETIIEADKVTHKGTKCYIFIIRMISQIIVLLLLIASSYAIYLAVEESAIDTTTETATQAINKGFNGILILIKLFQVQLVIVSRNFVFPIIFKLAEFVERHHPRTELKILLIRLCLMYITSIYVLIISLLTISQQCNGTGINSNTTTLTLLNSLDLKRDTDTAVTTNDNNEVCCWETVIGQELFKLSITHFLAELFQILVSDMLRWAIVRSELSSKFNKLIGESEFKLAENVLRLVYGQSLVWLGVLFSPLLILINFIKIMILFYLRAIAVSVFNRPPHAMFRIANAKNFYMAILLIVTFLCLFPVGYAIIRITPSTICGPFRGLSSMWEIVVNEIDTWPDIISQIIEYLQTATIIIPGIALLFIAIYYYITLVGALKDVNKDLRLQLQLEQNEVKERIVRDVEEQCVSPTVSPVSMKHRHKQLVMKINDIERQSANVRVRSSTEISNHTPITLANYTPILLANRSPSILRNCSPSELPNHTPYPMEKRVRVREVDDEDDILQYMTHTTEWSRGYDNNMGLTIKQTTL